MIKIQERHRFALIFDIIVLLLSAFNSVDEDVENLNCAQRMNERENVAIKTDNVQFNLGRAYMLILITKHFATVMCGPRILSFFSNITSYDFTAWDPFNSD